VTGGDVDLSVVIPSWNTVDLLRACLGSIRAGEKPETEVVVVDNASADGSADMVAAEFPEVVLRRNERNEGFARGCNQGIELARGRHVLLLNADTEVRGRALERLVEFLDANPEYGAAAAQLVYPDGSVQRACMRFPSLWTPLFFGTPLERWFPESRELRRYFMRDWDHADERDVEQPPAACLCLRREVIESVGVFDEKLWLFFNDVDLSLRMSRAGWKTRYLADARVMHHEGASTSKFGSFVPEWHKNRLAYYRKHFGAAAGPWVKLCVTLAMLDFAVVNGLRRLRGRPHDEVGRMLRTFGSFLRL
jgi:hypothetical protein